MSVSMFYVKWLQAKKRLLELVSEPNYADRAHLVDQWMKNHVFEVGISIHTSRDEIEHVQDIDLREMNKQQAISAIVQTIIDKELYSVVEHVGPFGSREAVFRVLTIGVPEFTTEGTMKPGRN